MRVNDPNTTGVSQNGIGGAGLQRAQEADRTGQHKVGGGGKGDCLSSDSIALSSLGHQLRTLSVDSPQRVERLEKLSAEVQAGRYQVNAQQLSQQLVEDALKPRL